MGEADAFELPGALEAFVQAVRERAGAAAPAIVCIAGGTSTGKSTQIAVPLVRALGAEARLIGQDMQQQAVREHDARYGHDHPGLYGIDACLDALERFRAGRAFDWPRFDFARRVHLEPERIEPGRWLVLEGLHALAPPLAEAADVRVYAEAPAIVRLVRRVLRNQYERYPGRAVPGRTAAGFLGTVLDAHRDLVRPQASHADLRVRTRRDFALLRERFALEGRPVPETGTLLRELRFDAVTAVRTVRCGDGSFALRVLHRGACHFDCALDADAVDAFAALDPEAL